MEIQGKFQSIEKKAQEFRQIYLYLFVNIMSAAASLQFCYQSSYFATGISKASTRHNPLAYMKYIHSIRSSQCIIGRFSKTAIFDCLVSGESLLNNNNKKITYRALILSCSKRFAQILKYYILK